MKRKQKRDDEKHVNLNKRNIWTTHEIWHFTPMGSGGLQKNGILAKDGFVGLP